MTSLFEMGSDAVSDADKQEILDKLNSVDGLAGDITLDELEEFLADTDVSSCEIICDVVHDELDSKCKEIKNPIARMFCRKVVKTKRATCKENCKKP